MPKRVDISENKLRNFYIHDKLTTFQIAEKFGCCQATIWKKLKKFNIKTRESGVDRVKISKNELKKFYINKRLSTWKIEKITGIPRGSIHRKLKEYNISLRDRATANIINPRKNFSRDLIEKAYLIGFRIGDLGVRKIYPNSKTITVASGSTIKAQIDLIEDLFKEYGVVRIKKTKRNKINIWVALNESFDFLLSKDLPNWVKQNKTYSFSFLAGFTDAEGSIKIYKNKASYSLGNYNFNLLKSIKVILLKNGIMCNNIIIDNRKGTKNSQGYVYRNNYCSLRITSKEELNKLFLELKKYVKHRDKIKDLNIAINYVNRG
jgi:hypothetical protein